MDDTILIWWGHVEREAVWDGWTNLNGVSKVRDGEICTQYFYKYNCKYFNINDLINTLIMLSHKITSIISHQLSYSTFYKTSSLILNRTSQMEKVSCPEQEMFDTDNTDNWFHHPWARWVNNGWEHGWMGMTASEIGRALFVTCVNKFVKVICAI